ncbi:MAG: ATP-binding cassette domain-containing protein [Pyrinomonadaceae bacterium]
MSEVTAALRGVTKVYPGAVAARDVSIEFLSGEIHALVGENGAGKSTLVKILAGSIQPDSGFIEVSGEKRRFTKPSAALMAGIGVVHQAGSLIETLSVKENLRLGKIRVWPGSNDSEESQSASPLTSEIAPNTLVRDLNPRQRQLVEIHRLLLQRVRLLVLDESTSNLSPQESGLFFETLRRLATSGYSVVVVSHKLTEIIKHCDRFTVLRKGRVVGCLNREQATVESMVRLFTDGRVSSNTGPLVPRSQDSSDSAIKFGEDPIVRFTGVATDPEDKSDCLRRLDLEVCRGEILGLVGRAGSGVGTALKLLCREPVPLTDGVLTWSKELEVGPNKNIGYVPADRSGRGLIQSMTVSENLMLRRRNLMGRVSSQHAVERKTFLDSIIKEFDIRPADPERKLETLSGGNAQKVLLAREMDFSGLLLIAESPTAGLDMGSAKFVRQVLRTKARNGGSVVLASDDLDEIAELADRVIVFERGRCVSRLGRGEISSQALGVALSGSMRAALPIREHSLRKATDAP